MGEQAEVLHAIGEVSSQIGALTGEVSRMRSAFDEHVKSDNERLAKLESFDAETTGQRKIDEKVAAQVGEREARAQAQREREAAKAEREQAKVDAKAASDAADAASDAADAKAEALVERAARRTIIVGIICAVFAAATGSIVTAFISHVAIR